MNLNTLNVNLGGGSLLQLAARSLTQMMSYIIETPEGKTVVIDGGHYCPEDADNLYNEIKARGGRVELWFFTHAHSDHTGAISYLFDNREDFDIDIGEICLNFPTLEWLSDKGELDYKCSKTVFKIAEEKNIPIHRVTAGEVIECAGMTFSIIHHPEDYAEYKNINSTSIIFKANFPKRSVLIMGDFDVGGQDEFLAKRDKSLLRCDIVQMPHHGQGGINLEFYKLIMPKICMYTAPIWLWENNRYRCLDPNTRGKGPFTIFETRRWMEELGAQVSCVDGFGDYLLI